MLASTRHLAQYAGTSVGILEFLAARSSEGVGFSVRSHRTKRGGIREIVKPAVLLDSVTKNLNRTLGVNLPYVPPSHVHGFVKGRSTLTNASSHVGKPCVLRLDLAEFFPSIESSRVQAAMRGQGFDGDAASLCARIVTIRGKLPIGLSTSPLMSNLVFEAADSDADGSRLSEDELVTTCTLLLNAGHEASVNVVGNGVLALLRHPAELARLRSDPALVPTAVEEMIRYDAPLQLFERTATEDAEVGGVTVPAGQKIAALLGSANRDPAAFAEPDRFDVARTDNPHIGFGAGIHFCLGAPLARVELQVSLATLLRRFPRLALAGEPLRRREFVIRGLRTLPVTV
jgi:hypothetical protein